MGFQVDLKEFNEILAKLQKDTSKTNEQLEQAKNALNGIIQADAMQGATGNAIVNDINNNQNTVVIGLKNTNELLIAEMSTTLQDFQSTTGESHENAVILEDALLQAQNKLSNLQPKKHEMDSRISNIYNSVSDLISLSMPNSQFDEKLVAASKELEDTIQKVQQFESKKEKSDAENILNALNNQVQIAGKMGSLSYTDPHLQAFFALDDLAKGIHEMDTQITKAKKEAQLQAEREMKKKQEEWADNHPVEAWLQNFSKSAGEKWDVLRKGTEWVGENIPFLKGLADDALVLEGFLGAAGSAISGIAIGATKLGSLVLELGEWGFNSIRGVETEQWKLDDIYGAGNTIKSLGQAIISWQDYPKYGKALVNSVKGYVEKALTDPYALGGAIFDIGSCFVGVGEVTAAVKGTAAFGKFAEGTKVFQVAAKNSKIVGKLEEVTALMNKLPDSMKNVVEKIKNIEIPNVFEPSYAGVGKVGGGGLDSLKDATYQFMKETGEKVFGKDTVIGSNSKPNKIKLTPEREKYYRKKIDEAEVRGEYKLANDIRYKRHCEETNPPLDRKVWDDKTENLRKSRERGREEEEKGRTALGKHLGRKLENNNVGDVVTYTSSEGHLTRPDSIGRNAKGDIDLVHDHKHKISDKEHVIHNDSQMRAERELAKETNGRHVVTISSDIPDLNGIPPHPRPSEPLAKKSEIYYTDPSSGKVTHVWQADSDLPGGGEWIEL